MPITFNITAENMDQLVADLKVLLNQISSGQTMQQEPVTVKKMPPDPRFHGSNTLTYTDKLRHYIHEHVEIGDNFSSTTARLILGWSNSQTMNPLQSLKKSGEIKMMQKGIYQRVI